MKRNRKRSEAGREAASRAPIKFRCPECNKKISVPRDRAGHKGACPRCQATMLVPRNLAEETLTAFVQCLECASMQPAQVQECGECHRPMPVKRSCHRCGDLLVRNGVTFCPKCGFELQAGESAA